MAANKNDMHARECWPGIYDDIPKAVWATLAWHLANVASGEADEPGKAEQRLCEEIEALANANILPRKQAAVAMKAVSSALSEAVRFEPPVTLS